MSSFPINEYNCANCQLSEDYISEGEESNRDGFNPTFESMDLKEELLRGVTACDFEKPSHIQQKTIKPIILGKDVLAQSRAGSGKSVAYILALLQSIDTNNNDCQALVLTPTREVAKQIVDQISSLGKFMSVKVHGCFGGTFIRDDVRTLQEGGVHIVVGTPGRINDMITRRFLKLDFVKFFVLDEADEMFSRGFVDYFKDICKNLPETVHSAIFTSTMPLDVLQVSQELQKDPVRVVLKSIELTLDGVLQVYSLLETEEERFNALLNIFNTWPPSQVIIYCNTRVQVETLTRKLQEHNCNDVVYVHGGLEPTEKEDVIKGFRNRTSRVLITTDILPREHQLSLWQILVTINYTTPHRPFAYMRRIGRSGAFGRKSCCVNLVNPVELEKLKEFEQFFSTQIIEMPDNILDRL